MNYVQLWSRYAQIVLLFERGSHAKKLLMSKSTIEPNGLHYPDNDYGFCGPALRDIEPSPCYFAGCVPNMPCKVEAYEKYCAEQYEPTNLDDLVY